MLKSWVIAKLESVKEAPRVLLRDPLRLLQEADGAINSFARDNGFTVIIVSTNLVFRDLFERATADPEVNKLLVVDRTPIRRRTSLSTTKAPPPFYPDFLATISDDAIIDLDLRQFLRETTNDQNWPHDVNDSQYARLIAPNLDNVLLAHKNLRAAHSSRFTDYDFKTIVAFSTLGVPDAAFMKLDTNDYWKIGLLAHEALEALNTLTPEITKPIIEELKKAPAPFCWFGEHDADTVIRAFYLAVILAQHTDNWRLLLANVDASFEPVSEIEHNMLFEAAPELVKLDPRQAARDLEAVEAGLTKDTIQHLMLDQMKIDTPAGFASAIKKEQYSLLVRALSLIMAIENLLSNQPSNDEQIMVARQMLESKNEAQPSVVDARTAPYWQALREAYRFATDLVLLKAELARAMKTLKVKKTEELSFGFFWEIWNENKLNRFEYYLSALERIVDSGNLLPRAESELPSAFSGSVRNIQRRIRHMSDEVFKQLDEINRRFQMLVVAQYQQWTERDTEVRLTSQFIRRCLKPHWDPQTEKAVIFIFDGMRYDIWDELLKPMLTDRMELIEDRPASSLLPSETQITRKALSAGAFPDEFDTTRGEDKLLEITLARDFNYKVNVVPVMPENSGTGETVRYRAGNLQVYIFELCDKELHKIQNKTLPDKRIVPSRPLAFIYEKLLKDIIDTEVMAIVRNLAPGTKVFVTADHGFARVGHERVWFDESDFNDRFDCSYLNCLLKSQPEQVYLQPSFKNHVIMFTPEQLRMPTTETRKEQKTGNSITKHYATIAFPKVGHSFSRPGAKFNPDAYTHGGISLQELLIPMAVLQVRQHEEGLIALDPIIGPKEVIEGEEIEYRMRIRQSSSSNASEEVRVDVTATYKRDIEAAQLSRQVLYVSQTQGTEAVVRFQPDIEDATDEERKKGLMESLFTFEVSYQEGRKVVRKLQTQSFIVQLNSERLVRRYGNLGSILGLTPKSMR